MVKRVPPLALGVIGTGSTSGKNLEALLNDYTSNYPDVAFVLPVTDEHWTDTLDLVHAWLVANELPYVAVSTSDPVSKALQPVLEGADAKHKVARVSTKMVQLLQAQVAEGDDAAVLVLWDDEDQEAALAVTKALTANLSALNLCNGLDPFSFDDDEDGGDDTPVVDDSPAAEPEMDEDEQLAASDKAVRGEADDYDNMGVRALRNLLRERKDEHDVPDRTIGQLSKDDAIRALRNVDNGKGLNQPNPGRAVEDDDTPMFQDETIAPETRTTRARRAFAEGAAEGSGDEAQALPRSRGADILENEYDAAQEVAEDDALVEEYATKAVAMVDTAWQEESLRARALELAIEGGEKGADAIASAMKYELYLKGEKRSAGRPRADGTPAQPREVGEDGKVVRRKPGSN